ncbi:hypothetical protein SESBI_28091 [Sesbania bispinosa]|nr:hypothetical protein SESBI_28091 [Sesbania bispinosa]
MSNYSSGSALAKSRGSNRFYTPPAFRRNQQKQQQRALEAEPDTRTDSDESALSSLSNLDTLLASLTPFVPVQLSPEIALPKMKGNRTPESKGSPYFFLEDLWESFREWSTYGLEVPLITNGGDSIKQYFVPYLSAIQLYAEPHILRRLSEDSGAESSKETSSADSSDEADKQVRGGNLMNINSQSLSRLTLRDRTTSSYCSHKTEVYDSPMQLVYEYFEGAPPHFRPPFHNKVSTLASDFPYLNQYRSSDISPSSWYPIYRIPVGSTLVSLDASFLTFHALSTHSRSKNQPQFHASSGRKVHGADGSLNISLPIFGLASYKLRGSILTPNGASEFQQINSLTQAAADWLQNLQVRHPDFEFFVSRGPQWR